MKLTWRDTLAAVLAVFGAVVVYAKLNAYSWWLIGSWKGALGVVAVTGLAILATYLVDLLRVEGGELFFETIAWLTAAVVVVGSLLATTNRIEFIWSSVTVGIAWAVQLAAHAWDTTHDQTSNLAHVH